MANNASLIIPNASIDCHLILIVTIVSVVMTEQKANLMALTAANQQLLTERNILGREAEELSKVTDNLNWTLRVILKFSNFPVNEYCPEKSKCVLLC